MSKFAPAALLATVATLAVIPVSLYAAETNQQVRDGASASAAAASTGAATAGRMLYGADGSRIAAIYQVNANGDAQVILNSKLVTVPAASLSSVEGKVTTSLTKKDLNRR